MVTLNEVQMEMIDPGRSTIQEGGQHNSFVDIDLHFFLYISLVPDTFAKGIICLSQSIVHFFISISAS